MSAHPHLVRQAALQAEAATVLTGLDLATLVAGIGPLVPAGSVVSGLMCWRDLDLMLHVGADFRPVDVLDLMRRIVERPGVVGLQYSDERGPRAPTDQRRDERYHVPITVLHAGETWRIDLTLWLHDPHLNIPAWHEDLSRRITGEQRLAVLRIKDVWHRHPAYPDEIGGVDIYTAVLDHGVSRPDEFGAWLAERGRAPR
ncbi:hypothetical protein [Pseudosporangium ferrugineum]|uniref:Nucleotidyltransferase AbiEii toxin of type IV toxin-antitoxin system n=1 Tax=Pseudosporangium ferrugineum TaxID=439699 RepID=A0A2T0SJM0_9ACTN|nr:hypothetical protein [Pseudosporangium ferrugineum]PRY33595.1 hypothetical protein CLV70_101758 [Pseudosporangium ferrugineum]